MKINDLLQESFWSDIKSGSKRLISYFSKVFSKLQFGQKVEIDLADYLSSSSSSSSLDEAKKKDREVFNLTAMIGYYNEYCVGWKLAYGLEHNGIKIKTNVSEGLKQFADDYRSYIVDNILKFKPNTPEQVFAELKRAEEGGEIMAKKIWDEIRDDHDFKLIEVDIHLTGSIVDKDAPRSEKGKEDVKITIRKLDTEEVLEEIKASLKLYKSSSGVNIYNATFASYLMTVITGTEKPATGKKAIEAFLKDAPQFREDIETVLSVTEKWLTIKNDAKKNNDPDYRKKANQYITQNRGYQQMRDLLFNKIFKYYYAIDKAGINNRILKRLGLDGADDVYLLVGSDREKMIAVSSRTSEAFKHVYEEFKKEFNVRFEFPDDAEIVNCTMILESESGEVLARVGMSFKEGGTFPHQWNMTNIVKSDKNKNKSVPSDDEIEKTKKSNITKIFKKPIDSPEISLDRGTRD